MWPVDDKMREFKALTYRDKLRVRKYLRRGEAPDDPRLAAGAVELAESYRRQRYTLFAWAALFIAVGYVGLTIWAAIDGERWMFYGAVAVGWVWISLTEPALRPKNMARSLEASRRNAAP